MNRRDEEGLDGNSPEPSSAADTNPVSAWAGGGDVRRPADVRHFIVTAPGGRRTSFEGRGAAAAG